MTIAMNDLIPGAIYKSRGGIGNGNAVQIYKVVKAPYFHAGYGDNGTWLMTAVRWVKSRQKFSGQAYLAFPDRIIEDSEAVIVEREECGV